MSVSIEKRQTVSLVIFGIGPVQDFIAGARTARDLWVGSFILSHLAQTAGKSFEQTGGKLHYPARVEMTVTPDFGAVFPNKFSVEIAADKAVEAARQAEVVVRSEWRNISETVRKFIQQSVVAGTGWDSGWEAQTESLLECYWSIVPAETGEARSKLEEATSRLDGRKRLRDFAAYTGDRREKDTIDGLFEQMGPITNRREDTRRFWEELASQLQLTRPRSLAQLGDFERLSAINLTKRYAPQLNFPAIRDELTSVINSTSDVATAWWRHQVSQAAVDNQQLAQAVVDYQNALSELLNKLPERVREGGQTLSSMEGRFLYQETLQELSEQFANSRPTVERVQQKLRILLRLTSPEFGPPPRYFGLLFVDGDRMGRVISGQLTIPDQPARPTLEISRDLLNYARTIREKIAPQFGATVIYTGGDDALLMVPTATALACAVALHQQFPLKETTVSMGLALAHYKHPLQRALSEGRVAEKRAKNNLDRNALAISVIKRSGEKVEAGSQWQPVANDTDLEVFSLLIELRDLFSQEYLSLKLPNRLRQETALLAPDEAERASGTLKELLVSEFRRLYQRQSNPPKQDKVVEERLKTLLEKLEKLAKALSFKQFSDLLMVAAFLARGGEE